MYSELGYFECSLISGFNDDTVTLKREKNAAKQNNEPFPIWRVYLFCEKSMAHEFEAIQMGFYLLQWYNFQMSTLLSCDAVQICTPYHIGSFKNYYIFLL